MNNNYVNIPGWLSNTDAELLYELSVNCKGSILEIGFFLGKSTSVICEAIKDSNNNNQFDSYDMDFKTQEEFVKFYTPIHKKFKVPKLLTQEVFNRNETTLNVAKNNLQKFGLLKYVNLNSGNFKSINDKKYDLIYCDVMHDKSEIELNLPDLIRLSNPNCFWAVHDIKNYHPSLIACKPNIIYLYKRNNIGVFKLEYV